VAEALETLQRKRPLALVVDLKLPDGTGWDVVEWACGHLPLVPILVLTSVLDQGVQRRAYAHRADYLTKGNSLDAEVQFVEQAHIRRNAVSEQVALVIQRMQAHFELSDPQAQLLAARVCGEPAGKYLDGTVVGESAVKKQVKGLLELARLHDMPCSHFEELRSYVWRELTGREHPETSPAASGVRIRTQRK
jgi:DNA-binding NarL/FixJ family response regulator